MEDTWFMLERRFEEELGGGSYDGSDAQGTGITTSGRFSRVSAFVRKGLRRSRAV